MMVANTKKTRPVNLGARHLGRLNKCSFSANLDQDLADRRAAELRYTTLPYHGSRSWILYSRFVVRSGKLEEGSTTAGEQSRGGSGSYVGLIQFWRRGLFLGGWLRLGRPRLRLSVGFPHVTSSPSNVLQARSHKPWPLHCGVLLTLTFTALPLVLHDCRGGRRTCSCGMGRVFGEGNNGEATEGDLDD